MTVHGPIGAGTIVLGLGFILFLVAAGKRFLGPLLPAGVLLGIGAGLLLEPTLATSLPAWASVVLGLGGGFLLVAAIDRAFGRRRHPSVAIPGTVLVGIALVSAAVRHILGISRARTDLSRDLLWIGFVACAAVCVAVLRRRRTNPH